MFRNIATWVDELAPAQGPFAHALDWAARLGRPLQLMIAPSHSVGASQMRACADACEQRHISWSILPSEEYLSDARLHCLEDPDLFVLGRSTLRNNRLLAGPPALLVCPQSCEPASRLLLLNEAGTTTPALVQATLRIARVLGARVAVLTWSGSERAAARDEAVVKELVRQAGIDADFDSVIGADPCAAVRQVASWRRCQMVVLQQKRRPGWWSWRRDNTMEYLMKPAESLAFLVLPGAGVRDVAPPPPAAPVAEPALPAWHTVSNQEAEHAAGSWKE